MRSVLWGLLTAVLVALPAHALSETPEDIARQAQAWYEGGEYARAADMYGYLTWHMAVRNADAWYNAGNAFARAGRRGAAIGAYRTALNLAPGHVDAAANLAHVRAQVEEAPATVEDSFISWVLRPARTVPFAWWRRAVGLSWLVAWGVATVAFWQARPWRRVAIVATVVCALSAAGWGAHALGRSLEPRAIVVAAEAPLRTGPGPDYLTTYSLSDGAECFLLTRQAGWVQVRVSDGGTGWTEADRVLALPVGDPTPQRVPAPKDTLW